MAITTTWSVQDMQRTDADGVVFLVYWSCVAASDGTPVLHCYRRRKTAL